MTNRVIQLAYDTASYVHHSGYPRYDGGHSEPEESCAHADCAAVREAKRAAVEVVSETKPRADHTPLNDRTLGDIIREALPVANLQILPENISNISVVKAKRKQRIATQTSITFLTGTENLTPGEIMDPERMRFVGVVIWVPREIYRGA